MAATTNQSYAKNIAKDKSKSMQVADAIIWDYLCADYDAANNMSGCSFGFFTRLAMRLMFGENGLEDEEGGNNEKEEGATRAVGSFLLNSSVEERAAKRALLRVNKNNKKTDGEGAAPFFQPGPDSSVFSFDLSSSSKKRNRKSNKSRSKKTRFLADSFSLLFTDDDYDEGNEEDKQTPKANSTIRKMTKVSRDTIFLEEDSNQANATSTSASSTATTSASSSANTSQDCIATLVADESHDGPISSETLPSPPPSSPSSSSPSTTVIRVKGGEARRYEAIWELRNGLMGMGYHQGWDDIE